MISAGEFLCTGQVYLASLLYMVEQNAGFNPELAGNLVIYLIAMCVPMVLLTVLVSRGKSVMSASHLSLKILPMIKLVYSIFSLFCFLPCFSERGDFSFEAVIGAEYELMI